jgi:hypothetical protein
MPDVDIHKDCLVYQCYPDSYKTDAGTLQYVSAKITNWTGFAVCQGCAKHLIKRREPYAIVRYRNNTASMFAVVRPVKRIESDIGKEEAECYIHSE